MHEKNEPQDRPLFLRINIFNSVNVITVKFEFYLQVSYLPMERMIESGIVRAAKYMDIGLCLLLRCIITCKYTLYCFDIGNEFVP